MEKDQPVSDDPVPNEDPQSGDTNEAADDKVEIQQPDGSPAPRAKG